MASTKLFAAILKKHDRTSPSSAGTSGLRFGVVLAGAALTTTSFGQMINGHWAKAVAVPSPSHSIGTSRQSSAQAGGPLTISGISFLYSAPVKNFLFRRQYTAAVPIRSLSCGWKGIRIGSSMAEEPWANGMHISGAVVQYGGRQTYITRNGEIGFSVAPGEKVYTDDTQLRDLLTGGTPYEIPAGAKFWITFVGRMPENLGYYVQRYRANTMRAFDETASVDLVDPVGKTDAEIDRLLLEHARGQNRVGVGRRVGDGWAPDVILGQTSATSWTSVLFCGDSITAGDGDSEPAPFHGGFASRFASGNQIPFLNYGKHGRRLEHLARHGDWEFELARHFHYVLVAYGRNDANGSVPVGASVTASNTYKSNAYSVVRGILKRDPNARILLTTVTPYADARLSTGGVDLYARIENQVPRPTNTHVQAYNEWQRDLGPLGARSEIANQLALDGLSGRKVWGVVDLAASVEHRDPTSGAWTGKWQSFAPIYSGRIAGLMNAMNFYDPLLLSQQSSYSNGQWSYFRLIWKSGANSGTASLGRFFFPEKSSTVRVQLSGNRSGMAIGDQFDLVEYMSGDGIHPSLPGHKRLTGALNLPTFAPYSVPAIR